ncbi:MAG: hypothetical protein K9J25_07480 [Bacteroidales bacterium]|nr:hypothetical protein [Bacteroidales bacterium]
MILHLMTPFRTHLKMYDEEINYNPENYDMFWESVESRIKHRDYGFRKISLKHSSKNINSSRSRFRSVGDNSLLRPLEVISLAVDKDETDKILRRHSSSLKMQKPPALLPAAAVRIIMISGLTG